MKMRIKLFIFSFLHILTICVSLLTNGLSYKFLEKQLQESKASSQTSNVITKWIKQPVDHFDKSVKSKWEMRFFERLDLWKPNGPVYLFIGGEGTANPVFLTGGLIYALANETNGAMFMSEHRFYGKSFPFDPKSKDYLKKLTYLSAEQALGDLAYLVKYIKSRKQFRDSKIIVIGGSYPGNLAAWMKVKYPKLIDAALASSAPVLAKVDFYEYLETVTDDFEQYGGEGCYDFIENMFKRYSKLLESESGIEIIKEEENICEDTDMSVPENQYLFIETKASRFMSLAQYYSVESLETECQKMMSNGSVYYFWEKDLPFKVTRGKSSADCYDYDFNSFVKYIREKRGLYTSWFWQTCTEFGYAQSSTSENQIFSSLMPSELYYKLCQACYGVDYDLEYAEKAVDKTNQMYGGLNPDLEHVIFVNGETDPWHRLGILEDVSYESPAIFIPRSPHCRDLYSDRPSDPDELTETRKDIKYWIKTWIGLENES